jgi:hypothetical protein
VLSQIKLAQGFVDLTLKLLKTFNKNMVVYLKATVSSKNIRNSEKRIMKQLGMNGEDERLKNGL